MFMAAKHKHRRSQKRTMLKRLLVHLSPPVHRNQVPARDGIRSAEEFRAILDRERARVNRNGHEFSLVVFDLRNVNHNSAYARHVAHVLSHRVRATDEIGWFDEQRIGVALPYAGPEGALKVAGDVCQTISTRALSPEYTVYTYPSRWMAGGDTPDPQRRFAGVSP
jgi:PleD family two-component response regulator